MHDTLVAADGWTTRMVNIVFASLEPDPHRRHSASDMGYIMRIHYRVTPESRTRDGVLAGVQHRHSRSREGV